MNLEEPTSYNLDDICDFRLQTGRQDRVGNLDGNAGREINTILSERAHMLMRQTFEVAFGARKS